MPGQPAGAAVAPKSWRIQGILQWTQAYLQGRIDGSPRLDAEVLLAHVLERDRVYLYTHYDQPLTPEETARYGQLVRRRAAQEPVAYLVGQREFYGIELAVDSAVLIPRPETEHLVEAALGWCSEREMKAPRVLDVGTGSGALAIALAMQLPEARVVGSDLSEAALAVARRNVERHQLGERVSLVHSDLTAGLGDDPFDLVVANLPYVCSTAKLPATVQKFEPAAALFAGTDGLQCLLPFCAQIPRLLRQPGGLFLELDPAQVEPVMRALEAAAEWQRLDTVTDLAGRPPGGAARR